MNSKKLKYQKFLKDFPNCPPLEFKEVEADAFRWVHLPITTTDFEPVNIISEPPPRMLDNTDKMCKGYGLSMFNTLENSLKRYEKIFKKKRPHQKMQFKEDIGCYIALTKLSKVDGLSDEPNIRGHFTFHEYENTDLINKIKEIFEIFNADGEFNNPT